MELQLLGFYITLRKVFFPFFIFGLFHLYFFNFGCRYIRFFIILEEMSFYPKEEWSQYRGQIKSTTNYRMPKWISKLHFHIDCHIPHHLNIKIPSYMLLAAQDDLNQSKYSEDIQEEKFTWKHYFKVIRNCNLWDEQKINTFDFLRRQTKLSLKKLQIKIKYRTLEGLEGTNCPVSQPYLPVRKVSKIIIISVTF